MSGETGVPEVRGYWDGGSQRRRKDGNEDYPPRLVIGRNPLVNLSTVIDRFPGTRSVKGRDLLPRNVLYERCRGGRSQNVKKEDLLLEILKNTSLTRVTLLRVLPFGILWWRGLRRELPKVLLLYTKVRSRTRSRRRVVLVDTGPRRTETDDSRTVRHKHFTTGGAWTCRLSEL